VRARNANAPIHRNNIDIARAPFRASIHPSAPLSLPPREERVNRICARVAARRIGWAIRVASLGSNREVAREISIPSVRLALACYAHARARAPIQFASRPVSSWSSAKAPHRERDRRGQRHSIRILPIERRAALELLRARFFSMTLTR